MEQFDRLTVLDHPLVAHKLSVLRDENTSGNHFRQAVKELALLESYEATRHLKTHKVQVKTPITETTCDSIHGEEPVIVPILRSGLAMLDALLELIPTAPVAHLGMYRDEETRIPHEYYAKFPPVTATRQAIVIDPMLATGGSLTAALAALRKRGVEDIVAMVIVASPEGVRAVLEADPKVHLFTCALDEGLTPEAFITPGLGDAGDRIYGTEGTAVEGTGKKE